MGTSETSSRTRKRHCSVFDRLAQWIHSFEGGYVHSRIAFFDEGNGRRSLHVLWPSVDKLDGGKEKKRNGETDNRSVLIEEGETVFCIPQLALITAASCSSGKHLPEGASTALDALAPSALHHLSRSDIEMALYLESQPARHRPYMDSLPDLRGGSPSCDGALPRCWPETELEALLAGSPVARRARDQKREVQQVFDALRGLDRDPSQPIQGRPVVSSFRSFSYHLAVVSSRAFEGFLPEHRGSCLVPLLDLCNHGRGISSIAPRSNLSYRWDADRSSLVVRAKAGLKGGDALVITYGAQGNAALLLNYGFCIPRNLEPDGSSNDVYELLLEPKACQGDERAAGTGTIAAVPLRTGPKSYSYGGLVRALEAVRSSASSFHSMVSNERDEPPGSFTARGIWISSGLDASSGLDLDDVTDSWDELGGGRGTSDSDSDDDFDHTGASNESGIDAETMLSEVDAFVSLQACLEAARSRYPGSDDETAPVRGRDFSADKKYYATLLIRSELRTLYFFHCATHQILRALTDRRVYQGHGAWGELYDRVRAILHRPPIRPIWVTDSDAQLIQVQVEELVQVYVKIRHPALGVQIRT